jgi:RNA polymerase sigma-70 factor (ECF subfamily)
MDSTDPTLLMRLRQPNPRAAWERFVHLYTPLLYYWSRQIGCKPGEDDDLVQEVSAILVQQLPEFDYNPSRSFRGWLRTIATNCWRTLQRKRHPDAEPLPEVAIPDPAADWWEQEHREQLVRRALTLMQSDFPGKTWQACWYVVVDGRTAADVAAELGMTVGAVHAARFRVLERLRNELRGMIE